MTYGSSDAAWNKASQLNQEGGVVKAHYRDDVAEWFEIQKETVQGLEES